MKTLVDEKPLWDGISALLLGPAMLLLQDLRVFSLFANGSQSLDELANALKVALRPARALMNAGVAMRLLVRQADGRYDLSEVSRHYLVADSPTYFGDCLDVSVLNRALTSFDTLKRAVMHDRSQVFEGQELFQSIEQQAAVAQMFTRSMHGHSVGPALAWPERLDLSASRIMLDIGGGAGTHAIAAVRQYQNLRSIVFDLAPICALAKETIDSQGLGKRVDTVSGDMWNDPFPPSDLHFYADIFHDWPPGKVESLVHKSFAALPAGGRIIAHEMLYQDDMSGPPAAAAYALSMLLWTEGQQYSGAELTAIFTAAGFIDIKVVPTLGYWSVVTGSKP